MVSLHCAQLFLEVAPVVTFRTCFKSISSAHPKRVCPSPSTIQLFCLPSMLYLHGYLITLVVFKRDLLVFSDISEISEPVSITIFHLALDWIVFRLFSNSSSSCVVELFCWKLGFFIGPQLLQVASKHLH